MAGTTGRLALPYPELTDTANVPRDVKALTDKLDPNTAIFLQGTLAARPAFGVAGRFYYATDTRALYYDSGTAWEPAGSSAIPVVAALPGAPVEGQEIYYQPAPPGGVPSVLWHLRRTAGKWLAVGQQESWSLEAATNDQVAAVGAWGVVPNGPSFVVPAAGVWRCELMVHNQAIEAAGGQSLVSVLRNGAVVSYATSASFAPTGAFSSGVPFTGDHTCAAADTLAVGQHRANSTLTRISRRTLRIRPLSLD